jgi:hypothetical protein
MKLLFEFLSLILFSLPSVAGDLWRRRRHRRGHPAIRMDEISGRTISTMQWISLGVIVVFASDAAAG